MTVAAGAIALHRWVAEIDYRHDDGVRTVTRGLHELSAAAHRRAGRCPVTAAPFPTEGSIMKNKLSDLNDHLFAQMERLGEEDLSPERIEQEGQRTTAMVAIAEQIVRNADLQLKAATIIANHGDRFIPMLPALGRSSKDAAQ